jgi:septal ring-binding cell division protein DamX
VLESGDFKSLRSGYFVVFSGQYDSRAAAERALSSLEAQAPQAYVRRVTPR